MECKGSTKEAMVCKILHANEGLVELDKIQKHTNFSRTKLKWDL
jgi:hypothetical protein